VHVVAYASREAGHSILPPWQGRPVQLGVDEAAAVPLYCCTALPLTSQVKVKVMSWPMVTRTVSIGVKAHLGPKTRFLLLSHCCGFADVGRPL
jgi:hypothetical protein